MGKMLPGAMQLQRPAPPFPEEKSPRSEERWPETDEDNETEDGKSSADTSMFKGYAVARDLMARRMEERPKQQDDFSGTNSVYCSDLAAELKEVLSDHQAKLQSRLDTLLARQEEVVSSLSCRLPPLTLVKQGTPMSPTRKPQTAMDFAAAGAYRSRRSGRLSCGSRRLSGISKVCTECSSRQSPREGEDATEDLKRAKSPFISEDLSAKSIPGCRTAFRFSSSQDVSPPSTLETTMGKCKRFFKSLDGSNQLDIVSGVMIFLNSVLLGVETEYMSRNEGATSRGFVMAQLALNFCFTVELVFRLTMHKMKFFTGSDWMWNFLDALLVCVSLVDVMQVAQISIDGATMLHGRLMRIVRLSRVVRTLRFCRALNYVHQFRKMVYSLQTSLTTLGWSLLLLFLVMYSFAVIFVQGVAEYTISAPDDSSRLQELQEYYGGLLKAYVTLYKAISNGQSWGVLMDPLPDVTFDICFLVYITIAFFGVLNVVSAVFVESAMASTSHFKELRIYECRKAKTELVRHMREVFMQIDRDQSGEISLDEMDLFLRDPQLKTYVESLEVTVEDTEMLFRLMDVDDSGVVDIDEFCKGLMKLCGPSRSFDLHLMRFELAKFEARFNRIEFDLVKMLNNILEIITPDSRPQTPGS